MTAREAYTRVVLAGVSTAPVYASRERPMSAAKLFPK